MHESGLIREMLKIVLDAAAKAGVRKVERIHLGLGDMSHVTPESVTLYFEHFSKGTAAEGATLSFSPIEGDSHDFTIISVEGE
ncbi:MAG: hydrogenase maturation nickel metallochaperone HypA [Dehalococcoidia bacterium]